MKVILVLFLFLLSFPFESHNRISNDYLIQCVSLELDGYIILDIWNPRKANKYKLDNAMRDAIHAILFLGIEGNSECIKQPPLLSSQAEKENFLEIQKIFFARKGSWRQFVRSSYFENNINNKVWHNNFWVYSVRVSKNELRKYLEQENIITSLNRGF